MDIDDFVSEHFLHFNAGELSRCASSLKKFLNEGGRLIVTLAGAMSTAQIGRSLGPAIKSQKIHAICCTGANLEEDIFNLVARSKYEEISDWRQLSSLDEKRLRDRGMNRVTDVALPEGVFREIEEVLMSLWQDASEVGDQRFPHEYLYDLIIHGELEFDIDSEKSWLACALPTLIYLYSLQDGRIQHLVTY
mgnify:CR=1 FL=1